MSEEDSDELRMKRTFSPELRILELIEKLNERVETDRQDMQGKMGFILEQQAQFTTNIQQLREVQANTEKNIANIENIVGRLASATLDNANSLEVKIAALVDSHIRLADAQAQTDEKITTLVDSNIKMDDKLAALVNSHIKLADAQAKTDDRLGAFISTVERYISKDNNEHS